ncbi:hypothetical protein [Nitratireductor indicus]|uniref:Uncharacterized protein n=1 Tax=Nitratireductor indicus C115 TaxID=1231190 RepID=K2P0T2_9HYPH|nr:hypothetical protein [Nitratireductor indicus]EKF43804.1 hypothetical protein NA8A_03290 [Nitratireductor indicus C115]MDS1135394.1 hypothetical protein [Nitratireductor indicus]SFQ16602.1 hypothetical protein SAMN05216176_101656 [Nitratireductor indicus]
MLKNEILEIEAKAAFSSYNLIMTHLHEAARLAGEIEDFKEHKLFSYLTSMCLEVVAEAQGFGS